MEIYRIPYALLTIICLYIYMLVVTINAHTLVYIYIHIEVKAEVCVVSCISPFFFIVIMCLCGTIYNPPFRPLLCMLCFWHFFLEAICMSVAPISHFAPSFDYRYAVLPPRMDEEYISSMKVEAMHILQDETGWGEKRVAVIVQIMSTTSLELPYLAHRLIGWDIESAYIWSQNILNNATHHLTGWPLGHLVRFRGLDLPLNRGTYIYSMPLLNTLCNMLTKPLEKIESLLRDDHTMDILTRIGIAEGCFKEYFSQTHFDYPRYVSSEVREIVLNNLSRLFPTSK